MKTNKVIMKQHLKLYHSRQNFIFKQQISAGKKKKKYFIYLALFQNNKILNLNITYMQC